MLVLAVLSIGHPLTASAAEPPPPRYTVEVCTDRSQKATDLITAAEGDPGPIVIGACGDGAPVAVRLATPGGTIAEGGGRSWALVAPPGTTIHTLATTQALTHGSGTSRQSFLEWTLSSGREQLANFLDDGRILPPLKQITYPIESGFVKSRLFCPHFSSETCPGGEFFVIFEKIVVELNDFEPPTLFGPVVAGGSLRGVTNVGYTAISGPGVASASLIVDGKEQPAVRDTNGGECEEPYRSFSPCRTNVNASLPLDTTQLGEGQHQVRVAVVDAAGLRTVSDPATITVRNLPTATGRPAISGSPEVGKQLTATTGGWEGSPATFAFQWFRCPATTTKAGDTTGCAAIAGATAQRYTTAGEDANRRELVRVTATNAAGSATEVSATSETIAPVPAPTPVPTPAPGPSKPKLGPKLSHVTLSRKRFRVARTGPARARGSVLGFSCSKPGRLTIVISRVSKKKKLSKSLVKLAADVKAGRSSVALSGEIGRGRFLRPGRYQVTITVRDAKGNASEPVSRPFTILPG